MEDEHRKMSAKEARDHLRELRKEHVRPVSKMQKRDVLEEIERLKVKRETTPPVASTPAAPTKRMNPNVKTIKEAKREEFPIAPEDQDRSLVPAHEAGTKKGMVRKTARKAYEPVTKTEVKKEEKALKKEEKKEAPKKEAPKKADGKPAKGSEEMKKKMAMLRAMRKKKEEK